MSLPTDTQAIMAKFFTKPTACPSGVSAGQIMPHKVLCNCLGLASFPSRPIGELIRLKCDNVEAQVSLFNTWKYITIIYKNEKNVKEGQEFSQENFLKEFKFQWQALMKANYRFRGLIGYCHQITKPHEFIVNIFAVPVSFCMFPCS